MKTVKQYINKVHKGLAALLVSLCVLGAVSCSDFLEIEPQDIIILEKFWNEKSDVENIVAGCYSGLQTYNIISRMMVWGEFRSENTIVGQNIEKDISLGRVLNENIDASNAYTSWNEFYTIINRCNTVILYAPRVAERDPGYTESELRATIAEVSALRDLCYFYLIRTFRDVPYSTQAFTDDDQVMDLPATKFDVVLDSLIADLEQVQNQAVRRYPSTTSDQARYQTGRITQDAIHAMLCEMYLWKKDYSNCIRYADMVIESKKKFAEEELGKQAGKSNADSKTKFGGFPLIDSANALGTQFGYDFDEIFVEGNSSESIFELTFTGTDEKMPCNGPCGFFYGDALDNPGYVLPSDFITTDVKDGQFNVFHTKYDGRAYACLRSIGGGTLYSINKFTTSSNAYFVDPARDNFNSESSWGSLYGAFWKDNVKHSLNKGNWIVYRLTDIMLLKAEALSQMMSNSEEATENDLALADQAFQLVTAINKRALYQATLKDTLNPADYRTKSAMTNLVYDERERELMFEGKRWYDLVRRSQRDGNTSYLLSKVVQKGSENSSVVQSKLARMDAIYWPYNIDELKVNHNLVQNPAFGSGENGNYEKTAK